MIFIGAWATLKIPMFLFETQYLGPVFASTRWILSLIGIVVIAVTIDYWMSPAEKQAIYRKHFENKVPLQPGLNSASLPGQGRQTTIGAKPKE